MLNLRTFQEELEKKLRNPNTRRAINTVASVAMNPSASNIATQAIKNRDMLPPQVQTPTIRIANMFKPSDRSNQTPVRQFIGQQAERGAFGPIPEVARIASKAIPNFKISNQQFNTPIAITEFAKGAGGPIPVKRLAMNKGEGELGPADNDKYAPFRAAGGAMTATLATGNPLIALRSAGFGGVLGTGVKIAQNAIQNKPLTQDLGKSAAKSAMYGAETAPTLALSQGVVNQLANSIPALKYLSDPSIQATLPQRTMTAGQFLKTVGETGLKRVLRAAIVETPIEGVAYGTRDQRQDQSWVDSVAEKAKENLIFNVGFAGVNTLFDAKVAIPMIKDAVDKALVDSGMDANKLNIGLNVKAVNQLAEPPAKVYRTENAGETSGLMSLGKGKYFARSRATAGVFDSGKGLEEYAVDPNAKLLDLSDTQRYQNFTEEAFRRYGKDLAKQGMSPIEAEGEAITRLAKAEGFDGLMTDKMGVVFDDTKLLTDIQKQIKDIDTDISRFKTGKIGDSMVGELGKKNYQEALELENQIKSGKLTHEKVLQDGADGKYTTGVIQLLNYRLSGKTLAAQYETAQQMGDTRTIKRIQEVVATLPEGDPAKQIIGSAQAAMGEPFTYQDILVRMPQKMGRGDVNSDMGFITKGGAVLKSGDHVQALSQLGMSNKQSINDFLEQTNTIRYAAKGGDVNIEFRGTPTKAQLEALQDIKPKAKIYVDMYDANGNTVTPNAQFPITKDQLDDMIKQFNQTEVFGIAPVQKTNISIQEAENQYVGAKEELDRYVQTLEGKYQSRQEMPSVEVQKLNGLERRFSDAKMVFDRMDARNILSPNNNPIGMQVKPKGTGGIRESQDAETFGKVQELNSKVSETSVTPQQAQVKVEQARKNVFKIIDGAEGEEKQLVERMKQSDVYDEDLRQQLEGTYVPIANKETIANAKRAVFQDAKAAEARALNPKDAEDMAIGAELFNYYMDKGNIKKANEILNGTAGVNEGQMIQILSQYDKTTPQGAVRFAQNIVENYNQIHPKKQLSLSEEEIQDFYDQAKKIQGMGEGRDKNMAIANLTQQINKKVPSTFVDKFVTIWKAGLLTSFRTQERNFVGNTLESTAEFIKDVPASFTDRMLSAFTGKRTMVLTTSGTVSGGRVGVKAARDIIELGYDPENAIGKYDVKQINWGDNVVEQGLKKYTDAVFRTLGAADKPFWNSAFARSLYSQAGAEAVNAGKGGDKEMIEQLVKEPSQEMLANAIKDADYATFHDKNQLGEVMSNVKKTLGKSEGGKLIAEMLAPFTGVPTSIVGKVADYSPIGLAKGAINTVRVIAGDVPDLQRQAAQDMGRGVVGTAIFALGAYLTKKGLMTGNPRDAAESRQWELEGKQWNSVFVGGKWRSINSIGPQTIIALAGSKAQEEIDRGIDASPSRFLSNIGKDILGQTTLTGIRDPLNAITDPERYGQSYIQGQIGSIVPNIVKDMSRSVDPYKREINSPWEAIKYGIPFARKTLTPKRDALGQLVPENSGLAAFFDLFNSRTPRSGVVVDELARLNNVGLNSTPSKIGKNQTIQGVKQQLTPQQLDVLEKEVGDNAQVELERLIANPSYQRLDDEQKASAIDSLMTKLRKKVRANVDVNKTSNISIIPEANAEDGVGTQSKYMLIDPETGSYREIDLAEPLQYPQLTGIETVDKKLKSSFYSSVTKRLNDAIALYQDGQLPIEQLVNISNQVDAIMDTKSSGGSGKKAPKYNTPMVNMKLSSAPPIPRSEGIKIASAPVKRGFKLGESKTDNRRYTIQY